MGDKPRPSVPPDPTSKPNGRGSAPLSPVDVAAAIAAAGGPTDAVLEGLEAAGVPLETIRKAIKPAPRLPWYKRVLRVAAAATPRASDAIRTNGTLAKQRGYMQDPWREAEHPTEAERAAWAEEARDEGETPESYARSLRRAGKALPPWLLRELAKGKDYHPARPMSRIEVLKALGGHAGAGPLPGEIYDPATGLYYKP